MAGQLIGVTLGVMRSSSVSISIVWFRRDLRLEDNPALSAATKSGAHIIPLYIYAPQEDGQWAPGAASQWWLHQSLNNLQVELRAIGSELIIRTGPSLDILQKLIQETGAKAVYWNRCYEPLAIKRDTQIKETLIQQSLNVESFNSALLFEPWTIQNKTGKPFQVFTPFWRTCLALAEPPAPLPAPRSLSAPATWPRSLSLNDLKLEPTINWAGGFKSAWQPGVKGAHAQLRLFLGQAVNNYDEGRNRPDRSGTSRLSPHLHFGEISPCQIWQALKNNARKTGLSEQAWKSSQYLAEIGWREFAYHLLYHFPHTPTAPLRSEFNHFPWRENSEWLKAWQKGQTGYPLIDAGLRELWTTGWMHNRVRMVVASFLVKDLLIDWQAGARWFWDTLVDADLASNTLGWQWTAGCGADAAPYFRVFNPSGQGEKFDPEGTYVRQWVPELGRLPAKWIHRPWETPTEILTTAKVQLGTTYPRPIVSHAIAREIALEAYQQRKRNHKD